MPSHCGATSLQLPRILEMQNRHQSDELIEEQLCLADIADEMHGMNKSLNKPPQRDCHMHSGTTLIGAFVPLVTTACTSANSPTLISNTGWSFHSDTGDKYGNT